MAVRARGGRQERPGDTQGGGWREWGISSWPGMEGELTFHNRITITTLNGDLLTWYSK